MPAPSLIQMAREDYQQNHYDTLPLQPGTKQPTSRRWQKLPSDQLWKYAPDDPNIAIRCGGGVAVIDADDKNVPGTSEIVERFLSGLGLMPGDYPLVRTVSGGRHFYIEPAGSLEGNYCHLASAVGAGEYRHNSGAYVVAPPSIVNGVQYQLASGDFCRRPVLPVKAILPLLSKPTLSSAAPRRAPTISRKARRILKGENLEKFESRSEAEQSLIVSLINTGQDYKNILALFQRFPCAGKFRELCDENQEKALRWFDDSYHNALMWAGSNESAGRAEARLARDWVEGRAWPGRSGRTDRAIFLAHISIAYQAGQIEYAAAFSRLAELAGVSKMTAFNATLRLINAGYLKLVRPGNAELAGVYHLMTNLYASTTSPCCEEAYKFDLRRKE